jgi:hypothetical protein
MPGKITRHQPSSLLVLPQDLRIYIAARVGATSERPWLTSAAYAVLAGPCASCAATTTLADVCR